MKFPETVGEVEKSLVEVSVHGVSTPTVAGLWIGDGASRLDASAEYQFPPYYAPSYCLLTDTISGWYKGAGLLTTKTLVKVSKIGHVENLDNPMDVIFCVSIDRGLVRRPYKQFIDPRCSPTTDSHIAAEVLYQLFTEGPGVDDDARTQWKERMCSAESFEREHPISERLAANFGSLVGGALMAEGLEHQLRCGVAR